MPEKRLRPLPAKYRRPPGLSLPRDGVSCARHSFRRSMGLSIASGVLLLVATVVDTASVGQHCHGITSRGSWLAMCSDHRTKCAVIIGPNVQ